MYTADYDWIAVFCDSTASTFDASEIENTFVIKIICLSDIFYVQSIVAKCHRSEIFWRMENLLITPCYIDYPRIPPKSGKFNSSAGYFLFGLDSHYQTNLLKHFLWGGGRRGGYIAP